MTEPRRLPLTGIRVLDLGMFWAGPFAGKWLADAGAEVIKIESASHPDNLRILARGVYPGGERGQHPWNRSGMINERNRGKLGLALEMGTAEGRAIFKELAAVSDVVIENFSTRVMAQWGLDYDSLTAINPRLILASIYSQGGVGPEREFVSFGGTLEQVGGLTALTGYPGELPSTIVLQLPDPLGGAMAAGLIVAALRQRRLTGVGTHIDLSQRENLTSILGEAILDFQMNQREPERIGNRDRMMAPHGCYRCAGDDAWVTIAIADDAEWSRLCSAIGRGDLEHDERFATVLARHEHQDALDEVLTEWTMRRGKIEAMTELQRWGVRSGAVYTSADLYADPHLAARGFWDEVDDPEAGHHRYPGGPMHLSRTPLASGRHTPLLGEHNEYVLGTLLGKTPETIRDLAERGVIGTEPTAAARQGRL
jgi:crotonobetainyl-CoA:carnitine CoA-transferase CaiB-like acyl-CoA transferase